MLRILSPLALLILSCLFSFNAISQCEQWHYPDDINDVGPALFVCPAAAPANYILAADQCCAYSIITSDAYCLYNFWDGICQDAYDACAATGTCFQVVCNEAVNLECDEDIPFVVPEHYSTCGLSTLDVEEDVFGDVCSTLIIRTWNFTDLCGNTAQCIDEITIQDTTAPLLTLPPDTEAECDNIPSDIEASAVDNCSEVELTFTDELVGSGCELTLERTYTATDECGNFTEGIQIITLIDTTPPVVFIPEDIEIECSEPIPDAFGEAFGIDNCSQNVDILVLEEVDDVNCQGYFSITRTFTAVDECGNESAAASQTITVIDTTAPELTIPEDIEIECSEPVPEVFVGVSAIDNCSEDINIEVQEEQVPGACLGNDIIFRTYFATDDCGNQSEPFTQVITIVDFTSPEMEPLNDLFLECDDDIPGPLTEATDNCSDWTLEYTEQIDGSECDYTILRTYTATDDCGNVTEQSQTITVQDITSPIFSSVPADASYSCLDEINIDSPIAEDNCTPNVEIEFNQVIQASECTETIVNQWTATDNCGNTTTYSQIISIDLTPCQGQWYIPIDINASTSVPAVYGCSIPTGYREVLQDCFPYVIAEEIGCFISDWDSGCNELLFECADNTNETCGDPTACNYNPTVPAYLTEFCDYSCRGCTYTTACNYNELATVDDNSCVYPGCTDPSFPNYNVLAGCDDGSCCSGTDLCPGDINGDFIISAGDLSLFLALFGTECFPE